MISPTIARHVLFMPSVGDAELSRKDAPLAAIICKITSDSLVNLVVVGPQGTVYGRQNVLLLHGEPPPDDDRHYCEWMEAQVGQAAQTDAMLRGLTTTIASVITRIAALEERAAAPLGEMHKAAMAASDARIEKDKL